MSSWRSWPISSAGPKSWPSARTITSMTASPFAAWLTERAAEHPDAFADVVGAEAAVTAWRRHLFEDRAKPATVNQALAAVTLMYEQAGLRIVVKRARIPKPGEPGALTAAEQGAVERAAARRGVRDAAIVAVLLYAGARVEECARLESGDVAITAWTGTVRLHGKGDEVRTVPLPANARTRLTDWLDQRGREPGPLWTGQRGALTDSGITQVVLAAGHAAGIEGLHPHRLRHTFVGGRPTRPAGSRSPADPCTDRGDRSDNRREGDNQASLPQARPPALPGGQVFGAGRGSLLFCCSSVPAGLHGLAAGGAAVCAGDGYRGCPQAANGDVDAVADGSLGAVVDRGHVPVDDELDRRAGGESRRRLLSLWHHDAAFSGRAPALGRKAHRCIGVVHQRFHCFMLPTLTVLLR